jgi:uncharacterized protein (TIGR02001 family)
MNPRALAAGSRSAAGLALFAALGALQCAAGAERWQLAMVAASDYVHRGLSQSDGEPALQAGIRYLFDSGVYAGVWGSTVSNARTPFRGAAGRLEVSYMAGFALAMAEDWDFDLALVRYEYPDSDAFVEYGYAELSASVGYRERLRFTAAFSRNATMYTRDGLQHNARTRAWELVGQQPLGARLSWTAGAGYFELREGDGTGYGYFSTGLAARVARLDFELQYIDTRRGERLFGRLAGPRVVLALMASIQP